MSLIGTGIDIVEVERIKRLLEKQKRRFLDRVFTRAEVEYCMKKAQPAVHLAARFAAKEAVAKALGTGFTKGVRMRDIEVETSNEGVPSIKLYGAAAKRYDSLGGTRILLSLSHTQMFALAHVDIC